eukprot:3853632-Amphidinium_carterae.1
MPALTCAYAAHEETDNIEELGLTFTISSTHLGHTEERMVLDTVNEPTEVDPSRVCRTLFVEGSGTGNGPNSGDVILSFVLLFGIWDGFSFISKRK